MCVHGLNVGVIARGTAGGRGPVVLFFAIDLLMVNRDGDEDAHLLELCTAVFRLFSILFFYSNFINRPSILFGGGV